MQDDTIERIESRIAFLEQANSDLSDVVVRQEREIQLLKAQVAALVTRLTAVTSEVTEYSAEQERPPHY